MKILFDVNVPKGLRHFLKHHEVRTAQEQGWGATKNGELLRVAEAEKFDLLVTADKNMTHQQNMTDRKIAMVVLPTNDWSQLKPVAPRIVAMIDSAPASSYQANRSLHAGPPQGPSSRAAAMMQSGDHAYV